MKVFLLSIYFHFAHKILLGLIDVVKTRTQKQIIIPGKDPKYKGIIQSCRVIAQEEGVGSLWRGLTPRLLRIVPGQAITFVSAQLLTIHLFPQSFLIQLI